MRLINVTAAAAVTVSSLVSAAAVAQPAAPVTTDAVVVESFTQTLPVVGRLAAMQAGVVAARVDGTLSAVHAQVGERVVRGQALANLDTAALTLQLRLAEARHDEASARLALATQEAERLHGLTDSAAVSRADYDDAGQRRNIARARTDETAAELALAKLNLDYAEVRAPFDGVVAERLTEVGEFVARGDGVARLVADRELELEADVPAARLRGLNVGGEVTMQLDNGSAHRAVVRAVVPEEDPRTRTRRVRFTPAFGDDAGRLAAEQSVTVFVPAGAQRDIVTVHKDAVVRRGASTIVFVVVGGVAEVRGIVTGDAAGERIEVVDGLVAGDLAVVRGNERLQPGQAVSAAPLVK